MVLDIECFRKSDDPAAVQPKDVIDSQKKRHKDVDAVQRVIDADQAWVKATFQRDTINKLKNMCSKAIGNKMKKKEGEGSSDALPASITNDVFILKTEQVEALSIAQIKALTLLLKDLEAQNVVNLEKFEKTRHDELKTIGNLLHPTVVVSDNEDNNGIERIVGAVGDANRKQFSHVDLIEMIDGVELTRGVVTAGNRGYYLKGAAVALEQALVNFSHNLLLDRGFTALSPPVFMRKEVMQEVAQLSQFDEELYKVTGKGSERAEDNSVDEKYLIATSEQPIAALHRDEWLDPASLPLRYVGISECFRQEVGSHGRDTRGIFRVHQFKKVEQFVITTPHDGVSWKMMEEMLGNAETFCQQLGLPYRVVNIVSGALNLAAAKKWDLEAWFPGSGAFRELVSCSNCTDYQSRPLKIRYGQKKKDGKAEFVHMLNSTLCATTRTVCCVMENFQVGDHTNGGGIVVPEALRPFMPTKYREFIPFVRAPPVVEEEKPEKKDKKPEQKK